MAVNVPSIAIDHRQRMIPARRTVRAGRRPSCSHGDVVRRCGDGHVLVTKTRWRFCAQTWDAQSKNEVVQFHLVIRSGFSMNNETFDQDVIA